VLANRLETMSKPTIAAINGFAVGTGLELAMACTIRIASENARFGQSEINLGIMPGNGGTQRLPRLVGEGRAMEMILTGDLIDAQEAYRIGLVNHVVPQTELMSYVKELAAKLAAKPPLAMKLAKNAIHTGLNMSLNDGIEYENKLFAILCGSQDKQEGVAAFLEKRRPNFQGK
jgi:enoyl-CoA hydratase